MYCSLQLVHCCHAHLPFSFRDRYDNSRSGYDRTDWGPGVGGGRGSAGNGPRETRESHSYTKERDRERGRRKADSEQLARQGKQENGDKKLAEKSKKAEDREK